MMASHYAPRARLVDFGLRRAHGAEAGLLDALGVLNAPEGVGQDEHPQALG